MQDLINLQDEIPNHIKALLNIIAFLIAATCVWYAYFIKGRDTAKTYKPTIFSEINLLDARSIIKIGEELERIADTTEQIYELMLKDSREIEIDRRVTREIERDKTSQRRRKPK